jgi:hypothetical protein
MQRDLLHKLELLHYEGIQFTPPHAREVVHMLYDILTFSHQGIGAFGLRGYCRRRSDLRRRKGKHFPPRRFPALDGNFS